MSSNIYLICFIFFITICLRFIFLKIQFLLDNHSFSFHKKINNKINNKINIIYGPPLCGGIVIFLSLFFFSNETSLNFFIFSLLIIGILSDVNILVSPKIRILLQTIVITSFVIYFDLKISDIRINLLNNFLQINLISIFFLVFCTLVLINGTNFIDGLNTLVLGYYIIILSIIISLSQKFNLYFHQDIYLFILILIILFIFNFFQKIYLGDSGAYVVAFITSFFIIDFVDKNKTISPYFICLLLWYPAFENLFSILRRVFFNKTFFSDPDLKHLHQLFYFFILNKLKLISGVANTLAAIIINLFNFIIFIISFKFYKDTFISTIVLISVILIYLYIYFLLKKVSFLRPYR